MYVGSDVEMIGLKRNWYMFYFKKNQNILDKIIFKNIITQNLKKYTYIYIH